MPTISESCDKVVKLYRDGKEFGLTFKEAMEKVSKEDFISKETLAKHLAERSAAARKARKNREIRAQQKKGQKKFQFGS